MTVWALNEAKSQGFTVREEALKEFTQWTKGRFVGKNLDAPKGGPTENISMVPVYLGLMARTAPRQESLSADDQKRMAAYLARWQEADGSWKLPSQKELARPFFESVEIVTLLTYLAVAAQVPDGPSESPVRASRDKAAEWLRKTKPGDSTQTLAVRLLVDSQTGALPKSVPPGVAALLQRQHADGGWGQEKDLPSDAYATGQALYALSLAGVANDQEGIRRGVAFLIATQKEDGSWPMKSRHKKDNNVGPITYFGSTWATLGLMRATAK
jgi:hypothetical protein